VRPIHNFFSAATSVAIIFVTGCVASAQSDRSPLPRPSASAVADSAATVETPHLAPAYLLGSIETVGSAQEATEPPAWWQSSVINPMRTESPHARVSVEDLLVRSLQHSSQVRVFSDLPLIRESSVVEADAAFDWHAFFDSRWDDISDPVGNTLTVGGGGSRFEDHNLSGAAGARRRTRSGGQFEVAQRFGFQDTNSTFFVPDQQGTSRLVLSYTHPLMRGRGRVYNESLTVLARIDARIAKDEFQRQLQSHLLEVVRAYWGLYLERGVYAQKAKAFERSQDVYNRLQRRRTIDAFESQLISAEAEVKSRRSELKRSLAAVRNAEDRIRSLVNDPELCQEDLELIPVDSPTSMSFPITMDEALATAVQYRPEVNQALKQIKAACVRVNMSKNEMMPVLNLVTETYVSGLRGEGNVGQAWRDQFTVGAPSYSIGLQYEVPIGNRATRTRHARRRLELRQLQSQYETTVNTLKLETRVAVREVETSFDELDTKLTALTAMRAKSDYILRRWELTPGQGRSGSYVLEDLLASHSQLARAENEYLASVVTYNLALMNVKRATGMLLQHEQVAIGRACVNGLPTQVLHKPHVVQPGMQFPTLHDEGHPPMQLEAQPMEWQPVPPQSNNRPAEVQPPAPITAPVRNATVKPTPQRSASMLDRLLGR